MGYASVATAYARAAAELTARQLSEHYTTGLAWFHDEFVSQLKRRLSELTRSEWSVADLDDFVAVAAGSDVDLISHLIEAVAAREPVALFPGDWYGFYVGSTHRDQITWRADATGRLACLCVPSVRNGHLTVGMVDFLDTSAACLLNLNLFPTLAANERVAAARCLRPMLDKFILSISFSRGFGMTASQLGCFWCIAIIPTFADFKSNGLGSVISSTPWRPALFSAWTSTICNRLTTLAAHGWSSG